MQDLKEFYKRFCPHRGIGEENTLAALCKAIRRRPYFVEFDVQFYRGNLYLGHPPGRTQETLSEALQLFSSASTFPKVDIKLTPKTSQQALARTNALLKGIRQKVLVNVSGDVNVATITEAERWLAKNLPGHCLLNADISRYQTLGGGAIDKHLRSLAKKPFSLSPNLESDIDLACAVAVKHGIGQLHFWAHHHHTYSLQYFIPLMNRVKAEGLEPYFDIQKRNIKLTLPQKLLWSVLSICENT